MTVGDMLIRAANKFPQKTAIICGDLTYTYSEFNQRVNRLAQALLSRGLQKGDRVGVLTQNCQQFLELYFAAAKTGGIFCPTTTCSPPASWATCLTTPAPAFCFIPRPMRRRWPAWPTPCPR